MKKKKITPKDLEIDASFNSIHKSAQPASDPTSDFCMISDVCSNECGPYDTMKCTIGFSEKCYPDTTACTSRNCPDSVLNCLAETEEDCTGAYFTERWCAEEDTKALCADLSSEPETCASDCIDLPPETSDTCVNLTDGCSD